METCSIRILEMRKELNLTQKQLADKLNVSDACVNRWENGLRTPSAKYIVLLCKALNCTSDYLLGLTDY